MRKRRGLTAEDIDIWRRAMRSTMPLPGRDLPATPTKPKPKPMAVRPDTAPSPPARQSARSQDRGSGTPASAFNGLDAATARRVRRGRLSVDGRIDLHGMRQDEAHGALNRFIMAANARGWRCVLVITGKGDRARREDMEAVFMARRGQGEGVLKRMVPLWLGQEPLRSRIYSVQAAHQRDGGSGALYIFLKRGRT